MSSTKVWTDPATGAHAAGTVDRAGAMKNATVVDRHGQRISHGSNYESFADFRERMAESQAMWKRIRGND